MIEETKEIVKDTLKDAQEVIKQRFFSPMYFYFILSWIITNWKFVFALFFIDSNDIYGEKLDYLLGFYPLNELWAFSDLLTTLWTISKLVLIPALSTYLFVWWFSQVSEKFYERNETFKQNKQTIKRKIDYEEKVKIAEEHRKIRDAESDNPEFRYEDKIEFNEWFDAKFEENIKVGNLEYIPSEVLFNTDFESYKNELNLYSKEVEND